MTKPNRLNAGETAFVIDYLRANLGQFDGMNYQAVADRVNLKITADAGDAPAWHVTGPNVKTIAEQLGLTWRRPTRPGESESDIAVIRELRDRVERLELKFAEMARSADPMTDPGIFDQLPAAGDALVAWAAARGLPGPNAGESHSAYRARLASVVDERRHQAAAGNGHDGGLVERYADHCRRKPGEEGHSAGGGTVGADGERHIDPA